LWVAHHYQCHVFRNIRVWLVAIDKGYSLVPRGDVIRSDK
jgi:hypothetical protein